MKNPGVVRLSPQRADVDQFDNRNDFPWSPINFAIAIVVIVEEGGSCVRTHVVRDNERLGSYLEIKLVNVKTFRKFVASEVYVSCWVCMPSFEEFDQGRMQSFIDRGWGG